MAAGDFAPLCMEDHRADRFRGEPMAVPDHETSALFTCTNLVYYSTILEVRRVESRMVLTAKHMSLSLLAEGDRAADSATAERAPSGSVS